MCIRVGGGAFEGEVIQSKTLDFNRIETESEKHFISYGTLYLTCSIHNGVNSQVTSHYTGSVGVGHAPLFNAESLESTATVSASSEKLIFKVQLV